MTRPISSRMHGMLDYPAAILLIASPWIFRFADEGGAARTIPIAIGVLVLLQSVVTDYEYSAADLVPLPVHLMMDVLAGLVLAASPWLFGFADEGTSAWLPHVLMGLGLLGSGLMTRGERETARGHRTRAGLA
jgi:hypothetical protein